MNSNRNTVDNEVTNEANPQIPSDLLLQVLQDMQMSFEKMAKKMNDLAA